MGIKFEEGWNQNSFIFFRLKTTGDMWMKDSYPYMELAEVIKAKGGVTRSELSWDGNWMVKPTTTYLGGSRDSSFECKTNMLFRNWNHLLKYLGKKGRDELFSEIFI